MSTNDVAQQLEELQKQELLNKEYEAEAARADEEERRRKLAGGKDARAVKQALREKQKEEARAKAEQEAAELEFKKQQEQSQQAENGKSKRRNTIRNRTMAKIRTGDLLKDAYHSILDCSTVAAMPISVILLQMTAIKLSQNIIKDMTKIHDELLAKLTEAWKQQPHDIKILYSFTDDLPSSFSKPLGGTFNPNTFHSDSGKQVVLDNIDNSVDFSSWSSLKLLLDRYERTDAEITLLQKIEQAGVGYVGGKDGLTMTFGPVDILEVGRRLVVLAINKRIYQELLKNHLMDQNEDVFKGLKEAAMANQEQTIFSKIVQLLGAYKTSNFPSVAKAYGFDIALSFEEAFLGKTAILYKQLEAESKTFSQVESELRSQLNNDSIGCDEVLAVYDRVSKKLFSPDLTKQSIFFSVLPIVLKFQLMKEVVMLQCNVSTSSLFAQKMKLIQNFIDACISSLSMLVPKAADGINWPADIQRYGKDYEASEVERLSIQQVYSNQLNRVKSLVVSKQHEDERGLTTGTDANQTYKKTLIRSSTLKIFDFGKFLVQIGRNNISLKRNPSIIQDLVNMRPSRGDCCKVLAYLMAEAKSIIAIQRISADTSDSSSNSESISAANSDLQIIDAIYLALRRELPLTMTEQHEFEHVQNDLLDKLLMAAMDRRSSSISNGVTSLQSIFPEIVSTRFSGSKDIPASNVQSHAVHVISDKEVLKLYNAAFYSEDVDEAFVRMAAQAVDTNGRITQENILTVLQFIHLTRKQESSLTWDRIAGLMSLDEPSNPDSPETVTMNLINRLSQ
jgi:hypothetical protein